MYADKLTRKNIFLFAMMFLVMMAFVIFGVSRMRDSGENTGAQLVSSQRRILDMGKEEPVYIVRLHNGNIAVFFADNPEVPIRDTDISQETLRNFDREQLSEGIIVYGDTELAMILEDFGS